MVLPGVIPALFMLILWKGATVQSVMRPALEGIVFSVSISSLCMLVLPRIAPPLMRQSSLRTWVMLLSTIAGLAVAGSLAACLVLWGVGATASDEFWSNFTVSLKFSLLITLLFGVSSFFHEVVVHRLKIATRDAERLRQIATEARLSSLESRVHPHFLFNTLNSISALIREDPARAERTVERLASLLRFSLEGNDSRLVPLSTELKIVRDYLEIEKTRFGARLRYEIDIPDSMNDIEVPPMAIQTLVENSVKHAVSTRREGATIEVRGRMEAAGNPAIDVIDDGPGYDATAIQSGHGLDLLRSRLALMFGPGASLQIASEPGRTRTTVILA